MDKIKTTNVKQTKDKKKEEIKTKQKEKPRVRTLLVAIAFIVFLLISYIQIRGEYLIHLDAGTIYNGVFRTKLISKTIVFSISALIIYVLVYSITKKMQNNMEEIFKEEGKTGLFTLPKKSIAFIVAILTAVIATKLFTTDILKIINITWFGKKDLLFNIDYSFYIFVLPFIERLFKYIMVINALLILYLLLYNIMVVNIKLRRN